MRLAWAFFKRDALIVLSYRASLVAGLLGNLFILVVFYFIGQLIDSAASPALAPYGGNYLAFMLIGVALTDCVGVSLTTFAGHIREGQLTGTLEATLMSPASPVAFVAALGLWDHIITSGRVLVYLGCGALFFTLDLRHANIGGALAVLVPAIVAFDALGMIGAGLVLVVQRGASFAPLLATVAGLLSGVYFPVEVLPAGVQWLALLLPSTHALVGLRLALLRGAAWADLLPSIGALALFDLLLLPCSMLVVRWAVRRALVRGTLGQY